MAEVLRAARLRTIHEYITTRRQTAAALVAGRPVLEECWRTERRRRRARAVSEIDSSSANGLESGTCAAPQRRRTHVNARTHATGPA